MPDERWLVVGLGNPGSDYEGTRHNVGADALRTLASREHATWSVNKRVRCDLAEVRTPDGRLVLAVPGSYMNRSGGPTQAAAAWFKVPPERIIVCHDDLDVAPGAIKIKRGGGHAGHNGLKDLDRALGTREYLRVRIGIGRPPGRMPGKDFVLRRFQPAEREGIDVALQDAADAVVALVSDGLEPTQNRFHGRP
ncbi:MAG: aminoacyl-tRNA hydrolase [Nitriliruptoraceae bacterium]|nr:aminoacyl-tRNA hydrolase [Nitriliruptoraceae bacterium]